MFAGKAEELINVIHHHDIAHRSGVKPSDNPRAMQMMPILYGEFVELNDELYMLDTLDELSLFKKLNGKVYEKAVDELADVYNCILGIAKRLKVSQENLDARAARKLEDRFPGLKEILALA